MDVHVEVPTNNKKNTHTIEQQKNQKCHLLARGRWTIHSIVLALAFLSAVVTLLGCTAVPKESIP